MKTNHWKRIFTSCLVLALAAGTPALAKKSNLKAKRLGPSVKERTDYFQCRKNAMANAKRMKSRQPAFAKRALAQCRDQFPGTSVLIDCKRAALREHKKNAARLNEAVAQCRKEYELHNFNPQSHVPFFFKEGKVFFAGAGLNIPRRVFDPSKGIKPNDFGNFSCSTLEKALFSDGQEEYLLFGNEIAALIEGEAPKKADIIKKLKLKAQEDEEFALHRKLGQVYGIAGDKPLAAYFPISFCHFERKLGPLYEGIKVYYLLERDKKFITPYFAVAFYTPQMKDSMEELAGKIIAALSEGYKSYETKKGAVFISKHEVKEFDDEGDPFNLCKAPQNQEFLAMIKPDKASGRPEYLLLSNISNLCKYGSRLIGSQLE